MGTKMTETTLDRQDVLPHLFPNPEQYLMVAGLAGAARDACGLTDEADYLLHLGGAMGAAVAWLDPCVKVTPSVPAACPSPA